MMPGTGLPSRVVGRTSMGTRSHRSASSAYMRWATYPEAPVRTTRRLAMAASYFGSSCAGGPGDRVGDAGGCPAPTAEWDPRAGDGAGPAGRLPATGPTRLA